MSLDVYLELPDAREATGPVKRIFVRRDGATVEVTRAEWAEMYPDREPVVMTAEMDTRQVYRANITHNLARMADEVELHKPLWRPGEIGIERAAQLIAPLRDGLARLTEERERLQEFNPKNGWGDYDLLVEFTQNYLAACEQWPEAEVSVWA